MNADLDMLKFIIGIIIIGAVLLAYVISKSDDRGD